VTREEKAALRAKEREKRRNPKDEEESHNGDKASQQEAPQREEQPRAKREPLKSAKGDELADMATQARQLLRSVRGVDAESVSGIARTQNGWKVTLEVVELRRIPESTDVLASYAVELDGDGKFLGFERGSRYSRSQAGAGDGR
jgi:Gas vesicle synthesis protein GvpO